MITLPEKASISDYQRFMRELEELHGWSDVDLVHNCFLMGEEVGELFHAVRRHLRLFQHGASKEPQEEGTRDEVARELVDVFNYLLAIANRLDIDLDASFRLVNDRNQQRSWS